MNWGHLPYTWVGDWSRRRASLSPDRTAICDRSEGQTYTYADVDARATKTARLLEAVGVDTDDRVAVLSRNRIELFDLFFATAKRGSILAPLSPRLTPPEVSQLLELVDPRLLVVESPTVDLAERAITTADVDPKLLEVGSDQRTSTYERVSEAIPDECSPVESVERSLGDPHLLLHTGGSTGVPKETVLTHGSIYWNAFNTITAWGLRPDDITPLVFPLFHTGGWNVLTLAIISLGGTLCLEREVDPGRILETIEEEGATVLVAVPTVLGQLARHDRWEETDLSTLRFVKSGGGPCRETIIDAWRERNVEFSQGYGLTECGPNNFAMPDVFPDEATASVGKPVLHTDVRIVDEDGTTLETDEIGELELAGPHAAAGYWGDTADDTFDGKWVSTGDLARRDTAGYYHIEGRKTNMFTSGGENVYPPEIENAIADHPAVEDVIVIGVPDDQWGTVGKAVIEPTSSADTADPLTIDDLEAHLRGRLARFKIPRSLEFVDALPTSGPSKLDREAVERQYGE